MTETRIRRHLRKLLDWGDAHSTFDQVVNGLASELQGRTPKGLPYSPWQLLEKRVDVPADRARVRGCRELSP